ncbi:MAG: alpha-mannosidase [Porphyromonadaceae bacterium]|nr:MAG: alpha-mannosidase [Porphyromonadaceae bacterium]
MKNKNNSKEKSRISRRSFISLTATGTAVIALGPVTTLLANDMQAAASWSADASKYRFHMIGQAHIDPVWLWPWTEGISVVHSTFRSALDRMNETPDFCFTASSAQFYQWVAENDPNMMAEIRKRVDEGRWNIVGGWWVEPDMNIPSGESMVRQGLYGQLTFQRILGHRATVAFNPDSFGHTSTLPQIIKSQGMENYIFMRPAPKEKMLPANLFWWEGADGTRVLTYRIPLSYNDSGSVKNRVEQVLTQFKDEPMKSFMAYYGAGDHGGGATKENIRSIEELKVEKGAPTVFFSTTERYFKEVREEKNINLPVVKDDLQHHAVGCYTAESEIKKGNRQSEAALVTAEKVAAVGSLAWGAKYPKRELTSAWQRVLFLQFHDSLAGTSLYEHSQVAREGYGYALDIAHHATYLAVQKLEWQVPAEDPASQYVLVFNPHAWEVRGNVEYDFNWGTSHKSSRVEDELGNSLLHQWTAGSTEAGSRKKLIVNAMIPPMGYRQIRLMDGDTLKIQDVAFAQENKLENEYLRIHFSTNGSLGIFDKVSGKELFSGGESGCRAVIIDDPSDTWSHDIKTFSNEIGAFENAAIKVLENGPLRATMRITSTYGASILTVDWTLYTGSRNLEAKVTLDWHEHLKMLKFSFPVDVESPTATYETPYGYIERATNGDEDPGQRWIDLSGKFNGSTHGLTVINDAKYGYNVKGNDMRISIARSAVYAHHNPKVLDMKAEHLWMDQGIQTFRMLLVPHSDTWKKSNIVRIAEEFMVPLVAIYQGIHGGMMPKSGSFLAVDAQNVVVSAIKQSENGEDIIIRCVETSGLAAAATIDLRFADRKWTGSFRPCEIKTLRIKQNTGTIKEVNLLEE